jgi:hypothetical protein
VVLGGAILESTITELPSLVIPDLPKLSSREKLIPHPGCLGCRGKEAHPEEGVELQTHERRGCMQIERVDQVDYSVYHTVTALEHRHDKHVVLVEAAATRRDDDATYLEVLSPDGVQFQTIVDELAVLCCD